MPDKARFKRGSGGAGRLEHATLELEGILVPDSTTGEIGP
jgi:hypothetical protein